MKEMIGLKNFRGWVKTKMGEVEDVLFPSLLMRSMLPKENFRLRNGRIAHISIAGLDDIDAIMTIQDACYEGGAPWGRIAVSSELRNKRSGYFLMVYDQNLPIAFIGKSMREDSMHVTNIATLPAYQGQGIATTLIQISADIARQLKKNQITLEVRVSNRNAKNLYRHLGFHDRYIKPHYYHDNGEDAIEMVYYLEEMSE